MNKGSTIPPTIIFLLKQRHLRDFHVHCFFFKSIYVGDIIKIMNVSTQTVVFSKFFRKRKKLSCVSQQCLLVHVLHSDSD